MNARLLLVLISCALSVVTGLVLSRGTGGEAGAVRTRPLIGLSMDTLKEERWILDRDLFTARAAELGADVLVESANSNDTRQLRDVDSLITRKVDALVIIPHNGEAMARDYDADSLLVRLEDLQSQVETLRSTLQPADELGPLIGRSRAFGQAAALARCVAF